MLKEVFENKADRGDTSKEIENTASELAALETEEKEIPQKIFQASRDADPAAIVRHRGRAAELPLSILAVRLKLDRLNLRSLDEEIRDAAEATVDLKSKFEKSREAFHAAREAKETAFSTYNRSDTKLKALRSKAESLNGRIGQIEQALAQKALGV